MQGNQLFMELYHMGVGGQHALHLSMSQFGSSVFAIASRQGPSLSISVSRRGISMAAVSRSCWKKAENSC